MHKHSRLNKIVEKNPILAFMTFVLSVVMIGGLLLYTLSAPWARSASRSENSGHSEVLSQQVSSSLSNLSVTYSPPSGAIIEAKCPCDSFYLFRTIIETDSATQISAVVLVIEGDEQEAIDVRSITAFDGNNRRLNSHISIPKTKQSGPQLVKVPFSEPQKSPVVVKFYATVSRELESDITISTLGIEYNNSKTVQAPSWAITISKNLPIIMLIPRKSEQEV